MRRRQGQRQLRRHQNPAIISAAAQRYGDQCVVLSADIKRVDGHFRLFAKGGRENIGIDALDWLEQGVKNGAGELVVNSIDTDGVKSGFDLELLDEVSKRCAVPIIASGGAGCREDFLELCLLMFTGTTFCLAVYWVFPNGLDLRPDTVPDNFLGWMVGLLYSMDTSTNVCPSIHVSTSVAVGLIAGKNRWFSKKPALRWLLYFWIVLICLSTMMIKQHSVIDVACGTILSLALFPVVFLQPVLRRLAGMAAAR